MRGTRAVPTLTGVILLTAVLLMTTRTRAPSQQPAPTRPNIVLVMADDQGWGDIGYNGHPVLKTPNLDEAAAAGVRFDRFYASAPVCSPTRCSVLTGRHPNRFGCFNWGNTLRPQEITIAEALRTVGYATGHFGKWHVGPVQNGSPMNPGASGFDAWFSAPNFYENDPILSREGRAVLTRGESSMVTVDAALEFIRDRAGAGQPFLALVWFGSPHAPHQAVAEDRALYPGQSERLQHFYGEITGMDRAFGKLRSGLRELGIADHTVLWYTSDNGALPEVGVTGGRGVKGDIYEGGLRVPALLEWPARLPAPRTTNFPAVSSDIYPTLLEIAGVSLPDQPALDGVSLIPLLEGRMAARSKPIGFWEYPAPGVRTPAAEWMRDLHAAQQRGNTLGDLSLLRLDEVEVVKRYPTGIYPGHSAWLDWPWKLHRIHRDDGDVRYELYNLGRDPLEREDLARREPARVGEGRRKLEAWLAEVVGSLNGGDYR